MYMGLASVYDTASLVYISDVTKVGNKFCSFEMITGAAMFIINTIDSKTIVNDLTPGRISLGGFFRISGRPDLCVRIQETTAHAHSNEEPSLRSDNRIEQKPSENSCRNLGQGSNNRVCRSTGIRNAVQRSKIQKETNKSSERVLEKVIKGMNGISIHEYTKFSIEDCARQEEDGTKHIVVENHSEFGQFDSLRSEFHVQNVSSRGGTISYHPKQSNATERDIILCSENCPRQHDSEGCQNE